MTDLADAQGASKYDSITQNLWGTEQTCTWKVPAWKCRVPGPGEAELWKQRQMEEEL